MRPFLTDFYVPALIASGRLGRRRSLSSRSPTRRWWLARALARDAWAGDRRPAALLFGHLSIDIRQIRGNADRGQLDRPSGQLTRSESFGSREHSRFPAVLRQHDIMREAGLRRIKGALLNHVAPLRK